MERLLKSRYKIGEKLSENPFSITYKGSFLGKEKDLVIKIYKRGTLSSNLINLMKRKVKERSLINHHGVAKLIDGDYGWQGFYYVREFIKGKSLAEIYNSGQRLSLEKAISFVEEICSALEAAHVRGIIHGALKPSNVFIDSKGVVKLADFVIVGEIKEAMPQKAISLLSEGKYCSPEELRGEAASISSDIYVLGVLFYEMLLGRPLVAGEGLPACMNKLKRRGTFNDNDFLALPRYLQDIIKKALQQEKMLRFASVAEFRESLRKKNIVMSPVQHEEYINIFENTVTQFGVKDLDKESEALKELGRRRISWGKEKHRLWILFLILGLAFLSGILYVFLFAW